MIIISPAKNLDFSNQSYDQQSSEPNFLDKTNFLVNKLKSLSALDIKNCVINCGNFINIPIKLDYECQIYMKKIL